MTATIKPQLEAAQCAKCSKHFMREMGADERMCYECDRPNEEPIPSGFVVIPRDPARKRRAPLTGDEVRDISQRVHAGEPQKKIAQDYNTTQTTVCLIKHGDIHRQFLRNEKVISQAVQCAKEYDGLLPEHGEDFQLAKMLFGAMITGRFDHRILSVELDVPYVMARKAEDNLRKNGIWTSDNRWLWEECPGPNNVRWALEFTLHLLVAKGEVVRVDRSR